MMSRVKQYILIAAAIAAFYFLLSHHIIFSSLMDFDVLKKQELTLAYTFYSLHQHSPYETLRKEPLRKAGIENIMLNRGMITEERLNQLLERIDSQK